jgi:hypothetical protein
MNSADVFSLEFDVLTRSSALAGTLEWFRSNALGAATHRQLLLELNYVINVHSRLREIATDVVPAEDWSAWQELLSVPTLAFNQGRSFLDDLRSLGLNSLDSVSLTPLPQTIAMAAYAHYQLVERAAVGLVGYLWFFERMPRVLYPLWYDASQRAGVSDKALRALAEGSIVDTARDNQVANCCRQIVRRPRDLGLATQSLDDTAVLFATMVEAAVQRAERRHVPVVESGLPNGLGQVALTG